MRTAFHLITLALQQQLSDIYRLAINAQPARVNKKFQQLGVTPSCYRSSPRLR